MAVAASMEMVVEALVAMTVVKDVEGSQHSGFANEIGMVVHLRPVLIGIGHFFDVNFVCHR